MKLSYTTLSVQDRTIREAVEIASAHGLANPRRLRSGERLVLPAID